MTTTTPSTEFLPDLAIALVRKHPKNPRHNAKADPELVASIQAAGIVEPLIVAPDPKTAGRYLIIAGHRRYDAARQAKLAGVPALVRHDLLDEGTQLEAMLVENLQRTDLSAIEEGEGYQQLELLGYKAPAIAKATGRPVKTVRARLRLLDLSAGTRKKVHAGNVTLEDAAAFVEFADDPEATTRLEHTSAADLRHTIAQERQARNRAQEIAAEVAELLELGAEEVPLPNGKQLYEVLKPAGPTLLSSLPAGSKDAADHRGGCLGWIHQDVGRSWARLAMVCRNPGRHAGAVDEAGVAAEAERDAAHQARQREAAQAADASTVRVDSVTRVLDGEKLSPVLCDVARALTPALLYGLGGGDTLTRYQDLMGLDDAQRWSSSYGVENARLLTDHLDDLRDASAARITRALFALQVACMEQSVVSRYSDEGPLRRGYFQFLEAIDHPFSPVDHALQAALDAPAETEVA